MSRSGPRLISTSIAEARAGRGQDRIRVIAEPGQTLILVADGAGGVAGGTEAAEAICDAMTITSEDWAAWLAQQDDVLAKKSTGLAAAVVLSLSSAGVLRGASVGDCEAWVFGDGDHANLTGHQIRKPLLGDGAAEPIPFDAVHVRGTLVVATDGLWNYTTRERIAELARTRPVERAVDLFINCVRLPNGALQDDVAIVLCDLGEDRSEA